MLARRSVITTNAVKLIPKSSFGDQSNMAGDVQYRALLIQMRKRTDALVENYTKGLSEAVAP